MTISKKYTLFLIVSTITIAVDQYTKQLILDHIPLYKSVEVIPGFFNFTHVHNPGGAFGLFANNGIPMLNGIFLVAAAVVLTLILYFFKHTPFTYKWLCLAFSLIFGGAIGNIIDRLRLGEVIDFLDCYIGRYHWPAFNVADSAISIGMIIFIYHIIFKKMPE